MTTVNMHKAKTELSSLVARAEAGEEIIIARRNKPVAKIVPVKEQKKRRLPGAWKDRFTVPDSFFDPLPEEELRAWEGEYSFDPDKDDPEKGANDTAPKTGASGRANTEKAE